MSIACLLRLATALACAATTTACSQANHVQQNGTESGVYTQANVITTEGGASHHAHDTMQDASITPNTENHAAEPNKPNDSLSSEDVLLQNNTSTSDVWIDDGISELIKKPVSPKLSTDGFSLRKQNHVDLLLAAEKDASPAAKRLLAMTRKMALEDKEIVRGSCWDYINTVWNRAGYPSTKRKQVHKGAYKKGPYTHSSNIEIGDWLYHINHSYHEVEHSGMFIGWVDESKNIGLTLTYGGENRAEPARFREYDLTHVYTIFRAMD